MSPESLSPRHTCRLSAGWTRWIGPALLGLAVALAAALILQPPGDSRLVWWLSTNAIAADRILPLAGIGVGCALLPPRGGFAVVCLLGVGLAAGFLFREPLLSLLATLPDAAAHQFRTGPLACLAAGLALLAGPRLRGWLLPVAALVVGATHALMIHLTDPTFHQTAVSRLGVLVALWIAVGAWLTVHAHRRPWFGLAGRILGSWLVAIGLLFGAASFAQPPQPLPAPAPETPASDLFPPGIMPDLDAMPGSGPPRPPDMTRAPRRRGVLRRAGRATGPPARSAWRGVRRLPALAALSLLGAATAEPASAHPDIVLYARVLFDFDGQAVAAIGQSWRFDPRFSQELFADFDRDGDGRFSPAESAEIERQVMSDLVAVRHLTYVRVAGEDIGPLQPFAFQAVGAGGIAAFSFGMLLPEPVDPATTRLELQIKDPDFLIGVLPEESDPVLLSGADGRGCAAGITPSEPDAYFGGTVIPDAITLFCER